MSYEDAESIVIGKLVAALHFEATGEELTPYKVPCPDAIAQAMAAVRETEAAVIDLINES